MHEWMDFLPFLSAVIAVALSGMTFAPGEWYRTLDKPSWTPPDWAFGPAWTLLYFMTAVAGWLVWRAEGPGAAIAVWAANLFFNAAWSWLMFGRRQIGAAFADAGAMLITILAFMGLAWKSSPTASLLFAPYFLWVAFAMTLNWAILLRNRSAT